MKKKRITHLARSIAIIVLLLNTTIAISQLSYSVKFDKNDFVFGSKNPDDGKNYLTIRSKGLSCTDEPGKPMLPVRCVRLLIPEGQVLDTVELNTAIKESIKLDKKIISAQPRVPLGLSSKIQEFVPPDSNVYNSENVYPKEIIKIIGDEYFDGNNHIIIVAVYPYRYYPALDKADFYSSLTFTLQYIPSSKKSNKANTSGEIKPMKRKQRNQEVYDKLLKGLVDNPEAIKPKTIGKLKSATLNTWTVPFYEYEVITTTAMAPAFNELVCWKKRKGYEAGVVAIEDILRDSNADCDPVSPQLTDDAAKLRKYLKAAWENGTMYVILGGDYTTKVPIRYGSGEQHDNHTPTTPVVYLGGWTHKTYPDAKIPSDLYFADFNGNWDVDGDVDINYPGNTNHDNFYGEPGYDNVNYYPEIFVGRLLCRTQEEVKNWTKKLLQYEQKPGNGDYSYLTKAFFSESDDLLIDSDPRYYKTNIFSNLSFLNITMVSELEGDDYPNPTQPTGASIISQLNNHYGLYGIFNHGWPTGFAPLTHYDNEGVISWVRPYDSYDAEPNNGFDNLTNINYPFIIYSISCLNVSFDDYLFDNPNQRCLGTAFTLLPNIGGPAYLGNTRYGWDPSSCVLFAGELKAGNCHIGCAEAISKSKLSFGSISDCWTALAHNLIGCPEMPIWTQIPWTFSPTIVENGTTLTVTPNDGAEIQIIVMSA